GRVGRMTLRAIGVEGLPGRHELGRHFHAPTLHVRARLAALRVRRRRASRRVAVLLTAAHNHEQSEHERADDLWMTHLPFSPGCPKHSQGAGSPARTTAPTNRPLPRESQLHFPASVAACLLRTPTLPPAEFLDGRVVEQVTPPPLEKRPQVEPRALAGGG